MLSGYQQCTNVERVKACNNNCVRYCAAEVYLYSFSDITTRTSVDPICNNDILDIGKLVGCKKLHVFF